MIKDLMRQMEDGDLRYELGFASTSRTLMRRIADSPLFQQAQRVLVSDPDTAQTVLVRAKEIYCSHIEPGYLHPDRLILATYVYLLSRNFSPLAEHFLRELAGGRYPEFRGANGVARIVVAERQQREHQAANTIAPIMPQVFVSWALRVAQHLHKHVPNVSYDLAEVEDESNESYLREYAERNNLAGVA